MKRFRVSVALIFTIVLVAPATSFADKDTYAKAVEIEGRFADWFANNLHVKADHAYVCHKTGGSDKCYSRTGRNSGGKELSGTRKKGDTDVPRCVYDNGFWFWSSCYINWGHNGTCHQEANLGMMDTGKTVSGARGYLATRLLFGTYGDSWLEKRCFAECRNK